MILDIKKIIDQVYADKPILAQLCLAQAILESSLDTKPSKLSGECFNLFGIKDIDRRSYKAYTTTECDKKACRKIVARFEKYPSYEDCVIHHRVLMQRPRYAKVWTATTFEEACKEIYQAGYATDPKYPSKLITRYNSARAKYAWS